MPVARSAMVSSRKPGTALRNRIRLIAGPIVNSVVPLSRSTDDRARAARGVLASMVDLLKLFDVARTSSRRYRRARACPATKETHPSQSETVLQHAHSRSLRDITQAKDGAN